MQRDVFHFHVVPKDFTYSHTQTHYLSLLLALLLVNIFIALVYWQLTSSMFVRLGSTRRTAVETNKNIVYSVFLSGLVGCIPAARKRRTNTIHKVQREREKTRNRARDGREHRKK